MSTTFTNAKSVNDEIANRIVANSNRLAQAKAMINTMVSDLTAMQTAYAAFVTDLDAAATANPTDPAWQGQKAQKDLMVADFNALLTTAQAAKTAIGA